jgi:hypothetical protein
VQISGVLSLYCSVLSSCCPEILFSLVSSYCQLYYLILGNSGRHFSCSFSRGLGLLSQSQ